MVLYSSGITHVLLQCSLNLGDNQLDSVRESDDSSYVVLGPQRRSFQGGCHVAEKEKNDKPSSNYDRFSHAGTFFPGNHDSISLYSTDICMTSPISFSTLCM